MFGREKMNRRAHTPTILIFIGALLLCGIALYTLISTNTTLTGTMDQSDRLLFLLSGQEAFIRAAFNQAINEALESSWSGDVNTFKQNFANAIAKRDYHLADSGNFFGKIRNGEYTLEQQDGVYILQVSDVFVSAHTGSYEARRTFNLEARFTVNGIMQKGL